MSWYWTISIILGMIVVSSVYTVLINTLLGYYKKTIRKTVKLSDINVGWWNNIDLNEWKDKDSYDWDSLLSEMEKGYDPNIDAIQYSDTRIINGNHRLACLKHLFGDNHQIDVDYVTFPKWYLFALYGLLSPVLIIWSPLLIFIVIKQKLKFKRYGTSLHNG
jgi:hypothetical protein